MGGRKPTQSESVFLIGSVSPINRPYLFLRTNHHLYAEIRTIPISVQDRLPAYGNPTADAHLSADDVDTHLSFFSVG